MCLVKVKDDEYSEPARVTRVRRVTRSPSPIRAIRVSRRSLIEERDPGFGPLPSSIPPATSAPEPQIPPPLTAFSTQARSERRVSREPSRAPSRTSRARTAIVEQEDDTSSSSSSSDVRSRKTGHTHKSSRSKTTAPAASEYSIHEREVRRERDYAKPKPEYETYRYVEAPRDRSRSRGPRNSFYDPPRASRDSYSRRERISVEEDYSRRRREYQR